MCLLELEDVDDLSSFGLVVESGHGVGDGFGQRFEGFRRSIAQTRFVALVQESHAHAVIRCQGGEWLELRLR